MHIILIFLALLLGICYYCEKQKLVVVGKKGKRKKMGKETKEKGLWYKYNNYYFWEWAQSVPYHTWPLGMMDKNPSCIGSPPLPHSWWIYH